MLQKTFNHIGLEGPPLRVHSRRKRGSWSRIGMAATRAQVPRRQSEGETIKTVW